MKMFRNSFLMLGFMCCMGLLNALETSILAENVPMTSCKQNEKWATVKLSDESCWRLQILERKQPSWSQKLFAIEPEQEFSSEYYFDLGSWNAEDHINVYWVEDPPFPAYHYLLESVTTGHLVFARDIISNGVIIPTYFLIDKITQTSPSFVGLMGHNIPKVSEEVISLKDDSLWKYFPVINIPIFEKDRLGIRFDNNVKYWVSGQQMNFFKIQIENRDLHKKYYPFREEHEYLVENIETGALAILRSISLEDLQFLREEYLRQRRRKFLGMEIEDLNPEGAKHFGYLPGTEGVVISSIEPGSIACKAGLTPGMLILACNHNKVKNLGEVIMALNEETNKTRVLFLCRNGELTRFYSLRLK